MNKYLSVIFAAVVFANSPLTHAAPVLQIENGILIGAQGVLVAGDTYDVQFKDGTCAQYFNGCNDATDFVFTTQEMADAASLALLDSVFLDSDVGVFDALPNRTAGCGGGSCIALTPIGVVDSPYFSLFASAATNGVNSDGVGDYFIQTRIGYAGGGYLFVADMDLSQDWGGPMLGGYIQGGTMVFGSISTWAVWNKSETVPEPESLALFGIALSGLGLTRRKAKQA